ncbi:tropomyosin-1-like [Perca flavescens]|uniref:tropomyosin-1-like n=1 Tax=Perca flavescens TaxID=8167 RepID=UPI00106E7BF7|nr:tropomyosin-1-like [Perca flavescens]
MRQAWQEEVNCIRLKNKDFMEFDGLWKKGCIVKQEQVVVELRTVQEAFDSELSRFVLEKDDLINKILTEKKALETETFECVAKLQKKESEIIQSEMTAKEISERVQELQRKIREMEDKWHIKVAQMEKEIKMITRHNTDLRLSLQELQKKSREMEDEWHMKVAQREEEIESLTQHNTDLQVLQLILQELAQKTDKEKAKLKRQEKKECCGNKIQAW